MREHTPLPLNQDVYSLGLPKPEHGPSLHHPPQKQHYSSTLVTILRVGRSEGTLFLHARTTRVSHTLSLSIRSDPIETTWGGKEVEKILLGIKKGEKKIIVST